MDCMCEIAGRFPRGPVVIVSRGLTLACVLCTIEDIPLEKAREQRPDSRVPVEWVWPRAGADPDKRTEKRQTRRREDFAWAA